MSEIGYGEIPELLPLSVAETIEAPDELQLRAQRRAADRLLSVLSARERDVIYKRYGFDGPRVTLREIAAEQGVAREVIFQVERRAIRKLGRRHQGFALRDLCVELGR